jgi:hypothetical protein
LPPGEPHIASNQQDGWHEPQQLLHKHCMYFGKTCICDM